jgi:hypothetical protein
MKLRKSKLKEPYTKCGKCGDVVWQRNRWGQIHYPYHVPRNPKSPKQMFVRKMWAITSFSWRLIAEEQRVAWCVRARSKKSRRRLGQSWPLKGFYYYLRENARLAYRGQPLLALPPVESREPRPELPLLTRTLSAEELQLLTASAQTSPAPPGPAPPSGA